MNWNANLYDDKHAFVFKYGEDVIDLLQPQPGEKILDLGCGTGYLTSIIASSGASVVGIDNSIEMITKAKTEYPKLDFQAQAASSFHFEEQFDAVFSNAVLHLVLEKGTLIKSVHKNLKKNGRFVFEMGCKHNVEKIIKALQKCLIKYGYRENAEIFIWYFPSLSEYASLLESNGFRVTYAVNYDRETKLADGKDGIKDWIQMFAGAYLNGITKEVTDDILDEVQKTLEPTNCRNGSWYADYRRLRMVALKQKF